MRWERRVPEGQQMLGGGDAEPFPDSEPRLWASPRVLTLNKLCPGSGETLRQELFDSLTLYKWLDLPIGTIPLPQGMLRCWGRTTHAASSPVSAWGCGCTLARGPRPGMASKKCGRGLQVRLCTPIMLPCSQCRLPGLFSTRRFFSSLFSFFSLFFFFSSQGELYRD